MGQALSVIEYRITEHWFNKHKFSKNWVKGRFGRQ